MASAFHFLSAAVVLVSTVSSTVSAAPPPPPARVQSDTDSRPSSDERARPPAGEPPAGSQSRSAPVTEGTDAAPPPPQPPPAAERPGAREHWTFSGTSNPSGRRYYQGEEVAKSASISTGSLLESVTAAPPSGYQGITLAGLLSPSAPINGNTQPAKPDTTPVTLSWTGFSSLPQGGVAVFFEVDRAVTPIWTRKGKRARLDFPNTRVPVKNNRHHLDLRYFGTVVKTVKFAASKRKTSVWIDLRGERDPLLIVRPDGHGQTMLIMEFPNAAASGMAPDAPAAPTSPLAPAAPAAPASAHVSPTVTQTPAPATTPVTQAPAGETPPTAAKQRPVRYD